MSFLNDAVFKAQTANQTLNSVQIDASFLKAVSVIGSVGSGTATGSINLQVSNDMTLPGASVVNWVNLPNGTVNVTGPGTVIIPKIDVCNNWVRVNYTDTSNGAGTATLTVVFHGQTG